MSADQTMRSPSMTIEKLATDLHYNLCYCSPELAKGFILGTIAPLVKTIAEQERQILLLTTQMADTSDLLEKTLALLQLAVVTDDEAWEEVLDEHSILETP